MIYSHVQPLFADQKSFYKCTAICLNDCSVIEIDYDICRQIIELINSDKEKPYIRALLFKFPMLQYFEAKKYVTQEYMLVNANDEEGNENDKKNKFNDDSDEEDF